MAVRCESNCASARAKRAFECLIQRFGALRTRLAARFATAPPFLAVEILSPDDRMSRVAPKIQEYFQWGVEWVWIIDPEERIGLVYSRQNPLGESVAVLRTENPSISIPLETALNPQD